MDDRVARDTSGTRENAVAIIGMAGRFPGAPGIEQFWRNLCAGVESITRLSEVELEDSFSEDARRAPNYVKARPILPDVDRFDAEFFGMYARESELTDPQHRVFLECAWEALESAGYDPAAYSGPIGVFAGCSINTYLLQHVCANRSTIEEFTSSYQVGCYPTLLGAGLDFLATRVSYKLDLKGPSLTLGTACSTSLLAVTQACQSLLLFQCDMALAGGASISFPQKRGYFHQEGGMVSADGHCRPFDASASGTVFGSGAGVVLLKRLEEALADGDEIYAVIRGFGVNNDGATKVGFTAPSVTGQAAAIEAAHANADVPARSITYVECHGTATPLGDPIEVAALTKAFRADTAERRFCALGSVKSNIGHLDTAAGVVGLIKTALALRHECIPASLHFEKSNPNIDFDSTPFFVNARLTPWPRSTVARRAGVSAFGVGGTNVHVVLEEAPATEPAAPSAADSELIVVSARTPTALAAATANLAAFLKEAPGAVLADVAHTLQLGRRAFDCRRFCVCHDSREAIAKLETQASSVSGPAVKAAAVAFMFPGQGSQYLNMGRDLYEREGVFRRAVDQCAELARPLIAEDLATLLYRQSASSSGAERLTATAIAQPAIFTIEYALAQLWMTWGIKPAAMIGHSVGEFVAAVIAGVISLEDALGVVALRGRLMQDLPRGEMLAVRLPERDVRVLLSPGLSIAAINAPSLCVVSGPQAEVRALEQTLAQRGVVGRHLHTSHAFHSAMVEPVVEPLRKHVSGIQLAPPKLPFASCVTGTWTLDEQAVSPDYWAGHARKTVRFADAVTTLANDPRALVLLEVGPGNVLSTLARQTLQGKSPRIVTSLQDAAREHNDRDCVLEALGQLWVHGAAPDWKAVRESPARRVPLPTYPFERKRYWIDAPAPATATGTPESPDTTPRAAKPAREDDPSMNDSSRNQRTDLTSAIVAILEELSGDKPNASDETTFLEMGYDSLFLTQVVQRLQSQFKVKITFRQLLGDCSTIARLTAFLAEKVAAPAAKPAAPMTAAPAPVAAPAIAALLHATAPAEGQPGLPPLEGIFREQLQAMTDLINRQMELLRGAGAGLPGISAAQAAAPTLGGAAATTAEPAPPVAAATAESEAADGRPSRFQVYKPMHKGAGDGIPPEQARHLADLITRYTQRTAGSKRFTQENRLNLADPRAAAGFRTEWKELVYPIVCARSKGSKLWDIDGNEYIDLVNGYGQTAFGHAPEFVVEAVKAQLDQGFAIGPQAELAGKVAALFAEITGNERVTFCNTGSEAVMAAMRVARTVTGRNKVVIFNGDYHGQFDEVLVKGVQKAGAAVRSMPVAPGIPGSAVENMIVLDYGTPETLRWLKENAEELAAVVVEPVQSRHPSLRPFEFLREVREITQSSGTAFVLDEVVTGFRVHPGGIQAVTGIRADMATYGKVVGGGMPIGILAGRARFMDALDGGQWHYGDDSFPEIGVTFFAGTFVRHPLALSAAWAVLQHVKEHGPQLQQALEKRTAALVERVNHLFVEFGVASKLETFSSWFYFHLHDEGPLAGLLFHHLRLRGIHIHDGFPCFLTTAHSDADIERIFVAFRESLEELQPVGIIGRRSAEQSPAGVPLTESQTEIWLAAQMGDEASCAFNESVTLRLEGSLDRAALEESLSRLISRHDALRASFTPTGEEMHIATAVSLELPVIDLSEHSPADAERALDKFIAADARRTFDMIHGPLMRAQLLRVGPDRHALLLTAHHIICDGWSFNVMLGELAHIYGALCRGEALGLPAPLAYSEYCRNQARRNLDESARLERYWVEQFREPVQPLALPTDRPRPALKSFRGASRLRRIDAPLYQAVKKTGAKSGQTLFVTLLGAFQALIGRLSGQEEVVVGIPTAGQSLLEDQILVGHCVNFLPMRARWTERTTVAEHLKIVGKLVLDAYEHQSYTLGTLVRKLALPRELSRVPLAEVQFNLERLADRIDLPGLKVHVEPNAKAAVNFDLFLNAIESEEGLRLDCDYNTDLFDEATIDRWLECYEALLKEIVANPGELVSRIGCLSAAERERVLTQYNSTSAPYPEERCVHELIALQAAAHPRAIAARFGDERLTYEALERRANQIAHVLLGRIGTRGSANESPLVGIAVERSLDMLVAMLGTLKAGCAYVPLDPAHPAARLRQILHDSSVAVVITDGSAGAALASGNAALLDLRADVAALTAAPSTPPRGSGTSPAQLAYVIYTSGSTGTPKGVEVTHRSLVNFLSSMARTPGLTADDVLLAVTTVSFDIAGLELYLPLTAGATVAIAAREDTIDGFALLELLKSSGATVMQATPATWRLLLEGGFRAPLGFRMLCGGEALPRDVADRLLEGEGELWNMYGPTETTIWSSCCRVRSDAAPISVGRPIANTQFYVLDAHDQPLPTGVPGQLHIGGDGVARGYHHLPEQTAGKFLANPFAPGRIYRTGDHARWLADGQLQVLGRSDHQVKLRGFRIELGEIETALTRKATCQAAAVVLREDAPGSSRLVAYYVPRPGMPVSRKQLETLLAEELPDYMIPSAWVELEKLPLTPNGKLDRAALPPDATKAAVEEYHAPSTPTETSLAAICSEVLRLTQLSVDADLLNLGADSIQLFQITARALRLGLSLSVKQLLEHRTIAAVAALLDEGVKAGSMSTTPSLPRLGDFKRARRATRG